MSDETNYNYIIEDADGVRHGTGLVMPTEASNNAVMATRDSYPDKVGVWDDAQIQKALASYPIAKAREDHAQFQQDQGQIGQCACETIEVGASLLRFDQGLEYVPVSSNWIYAQNNGGKDQGAELAKIAKQCITGMAPAVVSDGSMSYTLPTAVYSRGQFDPKILKLADAEAPKYKLDGLYVVPKDPKAAIRVIATALARRHPVIIAWQAGNAGLQNGYIPNGAGNGNHCSLLHAAEWIGGQWLVDCDLMNTWGRRWGQKGYAKMKMQDVLKCLPHHVFYVPTSSCPFPGDN